MHKLTRSYLALIWLASLPSLPLQAAVTGQWLRTQRGDIPATATPVDAKQAADAATRLYLCRANFNKGIHPGYLGAQTGGCIINVSGRGNRAVHYEILINDPHYQWQAFSWGDLPANAVLGGSQEDNGEQPFYLCRAQIQGRLQSGKLLSGPRGCRVDVNDREQTVRDFEILVLQADSRSQVFPIPMQNGSHLDQCKTAGTDCGEAAASAWCQTQGYASASQWSAQTHLSGVVTQRIGDGSVCDGKATPCTGFLSITCLGDAPSATVPADYSGDWQTQINHQPLTLHLQQTAERVTGQYAPQGKLQGFLSNRSLWGKWTEGERNGDFQLELTPDGQHFTGERNFRDHNGRQTETWTGQRTAP